MDRVIEAAMRLRDALVRHDQRIVFAESCTAGRLAGTLGALPGISQWLCGSFVVYRIDSKQRWLGVPETLLQDPAIGPVSAEASAALATALLRNTPEADVGLAITGDIGPGASSRTDGQVFLSLCLRKREGSLDEAVRLTSPAPADEHDVLGRIKRLDEATCIALDFVERNLSS